VFAWLQKLGDVEQAEMDKVFNNGIGFVMIVSPFFADVIQRRLIEEEGVMTHVIGEVREGDADVEWC
jgi:phosphoribosylformylglycinamidine cyclo-ligase